MWVNTLPVPSILKVYLCILLSQKPEQFHTLLRSISLNYFSIIQSCPIMPNYARWFIKCYS